MGELQRQLRLLIFRDADKESICLPGYHGGSRRGSERYLRRERFLQVEDLAFDPNRFRPLRQKRLVGFQGVRRQVIFFENCGFACEKTTSIYCIFW